jgi:type I restriction enzyme R subunit
MTPVTHDWDELHLAENPAVELLQSLGYEYVAPEALEAERTSLKEPVLTRHLALALKKLNPWLSADNVRKAVRAVTGVAAASLAEASEKLHTTLTYGISLEQDRGDGKTSHTVRFFDFDEPRNNAFLVTRQYKVAGAKKHILPDIVIFGNGIPLAVIECKSPTIGDKWLSEAVTQMLRYQEASDEFRGLGAPQLFETVQLVIGCCGQGAVYGTVLTPRRYWAEWKEPFPLTREQLAEALGREPTPQDIALYGLLRPDDLLDIIRNFVAFDAEGGKTVRKVCRYKQFIAVNKAMARIKSARRPAERGGVVWHTQGSGKSLTMLWLALKLRRDPSLGNPTLVVVTDRRDLDRQIRDTFIHCGFPNPEQAQSVQHLRELLSGPGGGAVMTTVQKFQEALPWRGVSRDRRVVRKEFPILTEAENVFVMVDEAHRTQYRSLAANMRQALPNACFLGFTGTPIDKKDRSTLATFGPYIDTYTIAQAVADGATIPIFYEGRLPELRILGQSLDKLFDHIFADRTDDEKAAIKKRYATEQAIAAAPRRIEAICLDLIEHFTQYIRPNGFKAQVVAVSRDVAVTYKETLDRLNAPESALVMSTHHNDPERLAKYALSKDEQARLIERFKDDQDPLAILVVCDMLLTGFDAPVEQVLYLDAPLQEHTLLQAIARVNRKADGKNYGLVVDYWGVSEALREALAIFAPTDVIGAMRPTVDELPRLQTRHQAALRFFVRVKDKGDLDACLAVLEPEDVRAEFDVAFRRFSQSMDMLLPDTRALPYLDDLRWLGKVRQAARARFHDSGLDIADCGAKVRRLIEEVVIAEGIQVLVKEVSLFSAEFDAKLEALKKPEAKASEMEHAIRHEIHIRLEENPVFYKSLRERLEEIVALRKQRRIDAAEQLMLFQNLVDEIRHVSKAAERLGLSETGYAIYGLLQEGYGAATAQEAAASYNAETKELAALVERAAVPQTEVVDWWHKDDLVRQIRRDIKRVLRGNVPNDTLELLTAEVVDLARRRKGGT